MYAAMCKELYVKPYNSFVEEPTGSLGIQTNPYTLSYALIGHAN